MRFDPDAYFADGGAVKAPSAPIQAGGRQYSPREVQSLLGKLASLGINKDKLIAQITPQEAAVLRSMGGSGKINPRTGLLSFDDEGGGDDSGAGDGTGDDGTGDDTGGGVAPGTDGSGNINDGDGGGQGDTSWAGNLDATAASFAGANTVDNTTSSATISDALTDWDATQGSGTNTPGELQGGVLGSLDAALGGADRGEFMFAGPTGLITDQVENPDSALSTPGFGDFGAKGISEGVNFATASDILAGAKDAGVDLLSGTNIAQQGATFSPAAPSTAEVYGPIAGGVIGQNDMFPSDYINAITANTGVPGEYTFSTPGGSAGGGQPTVADVTTISETDYVAALNAWNAAHPGDPVAVPGQPAVVATQEPATPFVQPTTTPWNKEEAEKWLAEKLAADKSVEDQPIAVGPTPGGPTSNAANVAAAQTAAQDAAAWSATQAAAATQAAQAASKADEENKAQEAAAAKNALSASISAIIQAANKNNFSGKTYDDEVLSAQIPTAKGLTPQTYADAMALARTILGEARGETLEGQIAAGYTALNRAAANAGVGIPDASLRGSVAAQVTAPSQYSWMYDAGDPKGTNRESVAASESMNTQAWQQALQTAQDIISGKAADPTGGATFYHNSTVSPSWAKSNGMVKVSTIGGTTFYTLLPWASKPILLLLMLAVQQRALQAAAIQVLLSVAVLAGLVLVLSALEQAKAQEQVLAREQVQAPAEMVQAPAEVKLQVELQEERQTARLLPHLWSQHLLSPP